MITLTYGSALVWRHSPRVVRTDQPGTAADGADLIIVVFAVVVIGGMGSAWDDHHRLCARRDRRTDQYFLFRSFQHRGFRPEVWCCCEANVTDRTGGLT